VNAKTTLNDKVNSLTEQLNEKEGTISSMKTENATLQDNVKDLTGLIAEKDIKIKSIEEEKIKLEGEFQSQEQNIKSLKKEKDRFTGASNDLEQLKNEYNKLQEKNREAVIKCGEFKKQYQEEFDIHQKLKKEHDLLLAQSLKNESALEEKEMLLRQVIKEKESFDSDKVSLSSKVTELTDKNNILTSKSAELMKALEEKTEYFNVSQRKVEELSKQLTEQTLHYTITEKQNNMLIKQLQNQLQSNQQPPSSPNLNNSRGRRSVTPSKRSPSPSPGPKSEKISLGDSEEINKKIAQLQKENVELQEKVSKLKKALIKKKEESNNKSKLIQKHIQEIRIQGRATPDREMHRLTISQQEKNTGGGGWFDGLFNNKSETVSMEVHNKMANILEETLLHNIQLQDDIKMMGDEMQKYIEENSKLKGIEIDTTTEENKTNSKELDELDESISK